MGKYVKVTGGRGDGKCVRLAHFDITYNMKQARRRGDKKMYINMMKLRAHVNNIQRVNELAGQQIMTLRQEEWKNGTKYVVRMNGQFKAVLPG